MREKMKNMMKKTGDCIQRCFWRVKTSLNNEEGMGTVEVILIILVLIGLVIIFKTQITNLVESTFKKITSQAGKI